MKSTLCTSHVYRIIAAIRNPMISLSVLMCLSLSSPLVGNEWTISVGGNAFRTAPEPGGRGVGRDGTLAWSSSDDVYSVFFYVDRPAQLKLELEASVTEGDSKLQVQVGQQSFEVAISGSEFEARSVGQIDVAEAGYVRVDLRGLERQGRTYAQIRQLRAKSDTPELKLDYVKSNEGNMFYWGRRGPSVHLRYQVPRDVQLEYAYSEITVPVGEDPIGSYYMANGFGEGYFGMQVNSSSERRVLFSVWSPFRTDNPRDIPADQRIEALARGPEVHLGEFGNEGSGGQSYLIYPWKAGRTYRFLTRVAPDGQGSTVYTSWFGDKEANEWRLIASFRRPQTDTWLKGFHSFLESFSPNYGHIHRRGNHGNVWVRDTGGQWHECTSARFSVDATGGGRHRVDFAGGSDGGVFYLRNCGFFSETGKPGESFTRSSTSDQRPDIDFENLPKEITGG